jgi:hypothetical protein
MSGSKHRRKCCRPEQAIQAAIFEHIAWRGVKGLFAFHVPLGGWRSVIEAKTLKSVGTVAGIPDVVAIMRDGAGRATSPIGVALDRIAETNN